MERAMSVINTLLVEIFNDILHIEQKAVHEGSFNDVSLREVHIIEAIGMYLSKSMSEVAKCLDITTGTLTVAINNLVKKEYVERARGKDDRRVVYIKLSNKGRLLYRMHEQFHLEMVRTTVEGLTREEMLVLSKTLSKLNSFLNEKYLYVKEKNNGLVFKNI